MDSSQYLQKVREQYENYPYPYRDPEDEKRRILHTAHTSLEIINCYCHQGKQDFQNYYALVAGCGTGDAVIDLAIKLRDTDSRIVALDISKASLDIAKARAAVHKLKNITWVQNSLLELPNLNLGLFDYVNCSGVLHHLADPAAGLRALKSVLKDNGCLALMLYAQYGRTGVYQMQELMRLINQGEENLQTQVDNTKAMLENLPDTNWFKRGVDFSVDLKTYGDIGIYDLFLHSQDRAYTIPQLYEFLAAEDLHLIEFAYNKGKILLTPAAFIKDEKLLSIIDRLDKVSQQAIAELVVGSIFKHSFFASRSSDTRATVYELGNVPFLHGFPNADMHLEISKAIAHAPSGQALKISNNSIPMTFFPMRYSSYCFKYLDGRTDLATIFAKVRNELVDNSLTDELLLADFAPIYEIFELHDFMFLKHKSVLS